MRTVRLVTVLCAAFALTFFVTNCSSCVEKAAEKAIEHQIEKETGEEADVDLSQGKDGSFTLTTKNEKGEDVQMKMNAEGEGSLTIQAETEGGQAVFQLGEGSKVPADFPKDVPIPDGAKPAGVFFNAEEGGAVMFQIGTPVAEVASFYEKQMPANGWKQVAKTEMQGMAQMTYTKGERSAAVTIAQDQEGDGGTALTLTVANE